MGRAWGLACGQGEDENADDGLGRAGISSTLRENAGRSLEADPATPLPPHPVQHTCGCLQLLAWLHTTPDTWGHLLCHIPPACGAGNYTACHTPALETQGDQGVGTKPQAATHRCWQSAYVCTDTAPRENAGLLQARCCLVS